MNPKIKMIVLAMMVMIIALFLTVGCAPRETAKDAAVDWTQDYVKVGLAALGAFIFGPKGLIVWQLYRFISDPTTRHLIDEQAAAVEKIFDSEVVPFAVKEYVTIGHAIKADATPQQNIEILKSQGGRIKREIVESAIFQKYLNQKGWLTGGIIWILSKIGFKIDDQVKATIGTLIDARVPVVTLTKAPQAPVAEIPPAKPLGQLSPEGQAMVAAFRARQAK